MKQPSIQRAALGFRVHSGWAVLAVVTGPIEAPTILDRCRIELADRAIAGSTQPYHAAQRLQLSEAGRLLTACESASQRLAEQAVRGAVDNVNQRGFRVGASGILIGAGKPLPALEKILASHPLLHAAEGELFRNAIVTACKSCGLSVLAINEKELLVRSSSELGFPAPFIQKRLASIGRIVGPPWRQDEKFATLVAWLAFDAAARGKEERKSTIIRKKERTQFSTEARKRTGKLC